MTRKKNPHIGSSFDGFLADEGLLGNCERQAIKEILADQIRQTMTGINQMEFIELHWGSLGHSEDNGR